MGAAAFFISQIILRSTILNLLALTSFHKSMVDNLVYLVIIGAFSAGLFEESARYGGFSLLKKNGLTWADAVAFGIGHGGVESILLVGLSQISNVVTSILIQTGKVKALKMSTLEKLCDALDCQPGDILEFKKDENADERFNDSKYL